MNKKNNKSEVKTPDKQNMICNLRKILDEKGVSSLELARLTGITPNQIYPYYTRGIAPTIKTALKISEALKVDINDIWKLKK